MLLCSEQQSHPCWRRELCECCLMELNRWPPCCWSSGMLWTRRGVFSTRRKRSGNRTGSWRAEYKLNIYCNNRPKVKVINPQPIIAEDFKLILPDEVRSLTPLRGTFSNSISDLIYDLPFVHLVVGKPLN